MFQTIVYRGLAMLFHLFSARGWWKCAFAGLDTEMTSKEYLWIYAAHVISHIYLCVCGMAHTRACIWRSEDNLQESTFSLHPVGRQAKQQVPLLTEPPQQPKIC